MKYIYIETYGCTANQNNSEILAGILKQAGYEITNNEKIAEILIINTCIVKGKTENKIKRRIQDLTNEYPDKLLIITGCMPETDAKQIKQLNSNALVLGTHHIKDIVNLIKSNYDNKLGWEKQDELLEFNNEAKINLPKIPQNKLISITQISEGCLGNCTYCKTKLAKGKLFSYPIEDIIKSIENDLKQGAKEIWITSQDNANYGLDWNIKKPISSQNKSLANSSLKGSIQMRYQNNNHQLPELLNQILDLNHRFKLRLGMMDPNNVFPILDELIEIYKNKKMYKFLHIPIQSASDKVLKDMNRLYNIREVEKIIKKFRQEIPNITLSTDIIVGYPTENEKEYKENIRFIKKYKPEVFNLSKMSIHKGTEAEKLTPLLIGIISKRTTELMEIHRKTAKKSKEKFLDKKIKVFVNKKLQDNLYEARDDNYNIVIVNSNEKILGKNIKDKIKKIGVHHMIGDKKI